MARVVGLAVAFSCCISGVCGAQAPARPSAAPVTVDQAVLEALEFNLSLLAERYEIPIADARWITASLRPNPVLTLSGELLDLLGTGFDAINGAGPPEYIARTEFPLERGGKRQARLAVADLERQTAELRVREAARQLVLDVQSAFVDVLLARENLQLARDNLAFFEEIAALNERRVQAGDLAEVELLRTRLSLLQFRNEICGRGAELRAASNRLQLLMGRELPRPDFQALGEFRREELPLTRQTALVRAETGRPDLAELRRGRALSMAELRLEMARGRVDYALGAEYRRQQGVNGLGNSLGFSFSAPLPFFDRNQGEIERVRQQQRQIELRIRALERGVGLDVENAFVQFEAAREQLQTVEQDMLEQARDVRAIAEFSYTRGEASLVEFLDAQRAFNEIMQAYNESRAAYARGLFAIDAATGGGATP